MFCNKCGSEVRNGVKFCGKCGTPINVTSICPECAKEVSMEDIFCPFCGYKLIKSEQDMVAEEKDRFDQNMSYLEENFEIVKKFYLGGEFKAILVKKKGFIAEGTYSLVLIRNVETLIVKNDQGVLLSSDGFLQANYINASNIIFLKKETDRVGSYTTDQTIACFSENIVTIFKFLKKNEQVVYRSYEKVAYVYDLPHGTRYVLDNSIVTDGMGNVLWIKKEDSDRNASEQEIITTIEEEGLEPMEMSVLPSESFPAPLWKCGRQLINLYDGNVMLSDIRINSVLPITYRDKQTARVIIEIVSVEGIYSFYEVKSDRLTRIYDCDETESLSENPFRYEKVHDELRTYKRYW